MVPNCHSIRSTSRKQIHWKPNRMKNTNEDELETGRNLMSRKRMIPKNLGPAAALAQLKDFPFLTIGQPFRPPKRARRYGAVVAAGLAGSLQNRGQTTPSES